MSAGSAFPAAFTSSGATIVTRLYGKHGIAPSGERWKKEQQCSRWANLGAGQSLSGVPRRGLARSGVGVASDCYFHPLVTIDGNGPDVDLSRAPERWGTERLVAHL